MANPTYKLAHIDKKQIELAARKALMVADSHYYGWSAQKQERFRATMSEKKQKKVRCVLLDHLLGMKCSSKELADVWNDIPFSKLNIINWASLLTQGIGEDFIYLNECMAEGKSLLDFPTLYDYDHESTDYFAYQHPSWVRLLIHEQFYYANLMSLATYLLDEIESAGNDYINQLIPHDYVDGKNQGKPEKGGFLWDMKIDARGLEAHLDELKGRWFIYQRERWYALSEAFEKLPPAAYTLDKDWDDDPHRFFIFNNASTLKRIRWQHFLSDCEPLITEFTAVKEQLEQEIAGSISWLAENHQNIMNNFDPKVIKLRKKRKIIISARALEYLNKID
jgi:hypothetical protein